MNQTLKRQLTTIVPETRLPWMKIASPCLASDQSSSPKRYRSFSSWDVIWVTLLSPQTSPLKPKTSSSKTICLVFPQSCHPLGIKDYWLRPTTWVPSTPTSAQRLHPGQNLQQREAWTIPVGPYQVPLTTETAVCTAERGWTHYTWIKQAPQGEHWVVSSKPGETKVTLKIL
jgi:hypothetical protein